MTRLEHIGVDVDGVLRDLAIKVVEVFEREYPRLAGQHLPISSWPEWKGFHHYFPAEVDFREMMGHHLREIWVEAPPYPGALPFLERLARERTLHIVTTQGAEVTAELTRDWLIRHQVPVAPTCIHITSNKAEAPIELLLDDVAYNLEAAEGAGIVPVCIERPWNREWGGTRIGDLDELFMLLERLEGAG